MGAQIVHQAALIGREEEQKQAARALQTGGGVLLVGEPGVGKTSLARAALAGLSAEDDPEILWLVASGSEPSIPFGTFAPFVPDIGGIPGRQPDPFFLLQTLRQAVLERSHGKPLILGVDDAHRLDGHSATLVYQLVAAGEARVVATLRAGIRSPAALRSLWKEELVERIDLEPLGYGPALDFARSLLDGGALGGELAEALWDTSRGNPLYLRELVQAGRRSGHIVAFEGLWRLEGDLTVGPRLAELVRERLDSARPDELSSLEVFAFAGPLPMSVAERLVPTAHIASLQRVGLLTAERSRRELTVRVGHPLFGESLREAMPALRRSELARLLASAFEADGRLPEQLLRVVTWRLDGDEPVPADVLLSASLQAAERQDWVLSARMAEAASGSGGGVEAALALADAWRALGRFEDALAALPSEEAAVGSDQAGRAAVLRAVILALGLGRFADADRALDRAAERCEDQAGRVGLAAVRAGILAFAGRPAEALAAALPLLTAGELPPRVEQMVRAVLALGSAWSGRPEEALGLLEDGPDGGGAEAGTWLGRSWMKMARMTALGLIGRVADMEAAATDDYRLGVQLNNRHLQGRAAAQLGWVATLKGQLAPAVARFREATTVSGVLDSPGEQAHGRIGLAEVLAEIGDLKGAASALAAARPLADASAALGPRWQIAAARLEAAEGAVGVALQRLESAGNQARSAGMTFHELMALHGSVRLGSGVAADRLEEIQAAAGSPLIAIMASHARALESGAGAGSALDDIAESYAQLQLRLFAAEAAAQACQAHHRAGNPRRATASASRAHFLLGASASGPAHGSRILALSTAGVPPQLTRREGEVATLAARGLPSSAIAERLCVSVRTVETHLARVYFKLGIGSRSELTPALHPDGDGRRRVEAG